MKEEVELILATVDDAELIHNMKHKAFLPLYEKYLDDETSPVNEKIDKVIYQLTHSNSQYYLIKLREENVGAIRIACWIKQNQNSENCDNSGNHEQSEPEYVQNILRISPLFILPEYQNRGIGQTAIRKVFDLYPNAVTWRLDTIKQEKGNCHLYEKCGFVRTGGEHIVNENMTLVDYEKTKIREAKS